MDTESVIRRVRSDEWREVRDLRLDSLRDPLAPLAFLETYETARSQPDEFWQARAAGAAEGPQVSQWVAVSDGEWVGTVIVVVVRPGETDYFGNQVEEPRAMLVGVYVRPTHRRQGLLERLVGRAAGWAAEQGLAELVLDVHEQNVQAVSAYVRCGFEFTGERAVTDHDADLRMRLVLS